MDTNVLLDVLTADAVWAGWSQKAMERAGASGGLAINDIVYSELSARFEKIEVLDLFIETAQLEILSMTRPSLFMAGKAYNRYRGSGGTRTGVLSDFFIGGLAAALGLSLLTRDPRPYQTYFPAVILITPTVS